MVGAFNYQHRICGWEGDLAITCCNRKMPIVPEHDETLGLPKCPTCFAVNETDGQHNIPGGERPRTAPADLSECVWA